MQVGLVIPDSNQVKHININQAFITIFSVASGVKGGSESDTFVGQLIEQGGLNYTISYFDTAYLRKNRAT